VDRSVCDSEAKRLHFFTIRRAPIFLMTLKKVVGTNNKAYALSNRNNALPDRMIDQCLSEPKHRTLLGSL
jgi:hypothetical protein